MRFYPEYSQLRTLSFSSLVKNWAEPQVSINFPSELSSNREFPKGCSSLRGTLASSRTPLRMTDEHSRMRDGVALSLEKTRWEYRGKRRWYSFQSQKSILLDSLVVPNRRERHRFNLLCSFDFLLKDLVDDPERSWIDECDLRAKKRDDRFSFEVEIAQ